MAEKPSPNSADYPPGYFEQYSGSTLIAVAVSFIVVECLFVTLRFFARSFSNRGRGLNDTLVVLALIANLLLCALSIAFVSHGGVGHHLAANIASDPARVIWWAKGLIALEWIYGLAVMLPKLAILSFYLLLFNTKPFRIATYILAAVITCTFLAIGIVAMFQCTPLAYDWDKTIPGGHCIDQLAYYKWMSLPNIVTDLVMLILPLPIIWSLVMTRNQKYGLTAVFVTGGIGLVSSCVRFAIFFNSKAFTDPTWRSVTLITWTIIEPGVYLIAACLPTLRPLLLHVFRRLPLSKKSAEGSNKPTSDGASTYPPKAALRAGPNEGFLQLHGAATDDWIDDKSLIGRRTTMVSATRDAAGDSVGLNEIPPGSISCRSDIQITRSDRKREVV